MSYQDKEDSGLQKARPQSAEGVASNAELFGKVKAHNDVGFYGHSDPHPNRGPQGCTRERLIEGENHTIPYFSSFFHNLGPRYQALAAESRLGMVVSDKKHLPKCVSNKTDGDGFISATPKLGDLAATPDDAVLHTPDSFRRRVQFPILETFEGDELSSAHTPSITNSRSPNEALREVPSTSSRRAYCTRRIDFDANGKENGVQFPDCTSLSSTGSTSFHYQAAPYQSRFKPASRDLQDEKNELGSSSFSPKRLKLDLKFLDSARIAPAILPSWRDEVGEIKRTMHAVKYVRAERCKRIRMRMSPDMSVSRSQEAMDRTLLTLRNWHFLLGLDNPACPTIASHIFYRAFRMFQRSAWPTQIPETEFRVRVLLAAAFWVAAKIVDTIQKIPKASQLASMASISPHSLIYAELPLLDALQWQLVRY